MQLLNGIHHLTFVTADMDRLIAFYERVFGARVTVDLEEEGLRHAFIEVGPRTVLHPFQGPGVDPPGRREKCPPPRAAIAPLVSRVRGRRRIPHMG